jgi:ATP-dependent DNA helicase PIF1
MMIEIQNGQEPVQTLIATVYGDIAEQFMDRRYFSPKVILTPLNSYVHDINNRVLDLLPGSPSEYLSIDSIEEQEGLDMSLYPIEFLNQLTISGMPPHKLRLKVGAPVILLRNIDGDQGLCNGTRLQIVELRPNCLLAIILTGSREGQRVAIPRIPLIADDVGLPFKLRRRQFPLQLAFAMTINKAQGQTVREMGLYLPSPVFAHGQLYVALSRSTSRRGIKIAAGYTVHEDDNGSCITNHVYPGIAGE